MLLFPEPFKSVLVNVQQNVGNKTCCMRIARGVVMIFLCECKDARLFVLKVLNRLCQLACWHCSSSVCGSVSLTPAAHCSTLTVGAVGFCVFIYQTSLNAFCLAVFPDTCGFKFPWDTGRAGSVCYLFRCWDGQHVHSLPSGWRGVFFLNACCQIIQAGLAFPFLKSSDWHTFSLVVCLFSTLDSCFPL